VLDKLDPRYFDSTYNELTGTFTFLGTQQHDAIDSIYTEAKKPTPPSLAVEILTTLATVALGVPISVLAQRVEQAALSRLLPLIADPLMHENEALKRSAQLAVDRVRMYAKAAGDALKDGAKNLTGPYVRKNIQDGKLPIDAFFEGLKKSANDTAHRGFRAAEKNREPLRDLADVHPRLPMYIAKTLLDAQTETFNTAYDIQREETLARWLDYQAQSEVGGITVRPTPTGDVISITDLGSLTRRQIRNTDTPGLIYVDAYIGIAGWPPTPGGLFAREGYIPGLSAAMLKLIEGKFIKDIGLPIIYRVNSISELGGAGQNKPVGPSIADVDLFIVAVDETGVVGRTSHFYPWHQRALESIKHPGMGVEYTVHAELGWLRPKDLHVQADKE